MATLADTIRSVREYLGYPDHASLTDPIIENAILGRIDKYRTRMSLTNQNWFTNYAYLSVDPDTNIYLVPDGPEGPVGRPSKVEFYDENYPTRNGPEIRIIQLQDSDLIVQNDYWFMNNFPIISPDIKKGRGALNP